MDGYIRVSRRGGREGESFISPQVQWAKIDGWAKLHEVEIVRWWEEIDQSGAKLERPMFQQALARCEAGETGGIVVARLDRFARSAVDALESIKRLNIAGARLVSVEDNFDGSHPMGRFAIGILTLIAELELQRIKESWSQATTAAIDRGVHISPHPPVGYQRDKDGRLERVEPAASAVRDVFRQRALGASWAELARLLEGREVFPATGNDHWSRSGLSALVRNTVYLGHARYGEVVNEQAHPSLVSRAEFDAAQAVKKSLFRPHDGSVASQALLGGLVRCAGCGHTLKITGNTNRASGERRPVYYCIGRYAKGPCTARATVTASILDPHVEAQVLAVLRADGGPIAEAVRASAELDAAAAAVARAEHELDAFVGNPTLLTVLGEPRFVEGVQVRQQALDRACETLAVLRSQSELAAELGDGDLLTAWPDLTIQQKRRLLHGLLEQVIVTRADGRGRNSTPISGRTQILLRGGTPLDRPETASAQRSRTPRKTSGA